MHAYKHTSSLGILSDVPSAVIRINSSVFLRGAEMKFTIEQRVFIVETQGKKKLRESVFESFVVNIQPHQFPQSHVYVSL
jgi:hypothetical protein